MKTLMIATLIVLGGAIHLGRPAVAEAMIPCTVAGTSGFCDALLFFLCGSSEEGSCSFGCNGGEITSIENVNCG